MTSIQQLLTDNIAIWISADNGKKSGRGRSSSNGDSVYGIKKLRELILELAVSGKLVPQDPNDEPASELIKRIKAEKSKLVADGKMKKERTLLSITEEEKLFALPHGWIWQRLGNLCILENGDRGKNYPNKSLLVASGIPFVNAGHLQNGLINKNEMTFITKERFDILGSGKFQESDILFCLRGSLGKSALVKGFKEGAIASSLVIIRLFSNLDPIYFVNYFDCPLSLLMIKKYDNGTAQPNLSSTDLAKFLVPLPPLAEQRRIVAKIDELMALCDQMETQHINVAEAHEKLVTHLLGTLTQSQSAEEFSENWQRIAAHFDILFTTEASIDALKQTILQLGVMGKLVPQDPNDEPASELLKRIQAEKAKLIATGKIKREKPLPPITEKEKTFVIPKGWVWVQMADICIQITDGTHQTPKYVPSGRPFLSAQNVKPFKFMPSEHKFVSQDDFDSIRKNRIPEKGDILLTRVGAMIGEAAVIDIDFEFAFYVSLGLLKLSKQAAISDFIVLWLNSPLGTSTSVKNTLGRGVSAGNLNLSLIRNFVIGLPPVSEQHRIVTKVNELMALCDQLKSKVTDVRQLQQKLADVMVEQAVCSI